MVILIRCNDIVSDPRAMKYVRYLRETNQEYKLIGWDREGVMSDSDDTIYLRTKAEYNVGGLKAAINRVKWMWFVLKVLKALKHNSNDTIHACDLDCAFPATFYKRFFGAKGVKVLFDIFDWFSATLFDQNVIIRIAFNFMERFSVKHSDYIVICEPERVDQITFDFDKAKLSCLPNIPSFAHNDFLKQDDSLKFNNNRLTFAYVGGFSNDRCLNEIVSIAEKGIINLLIAGFGHAELEDRLRELNGSDNIKYFGKVKYTDGLDIMYNADVVYAMYQTFNPNNIYAAPNKNYEAMFLGKPLFTTKGTIVEEKVVKGNIGFISGESENEIIEVIRDISTNDVIEKGINAHKLWNEKYSTFTADFLSGEYTNMIKNK